ncbi:hypothetical protein [Fictibacillus gelatini]|uniref:hypothetical protein n=1 Tax=Fictibacillus gelatini TaxID=225985 RepID=UPI000428E2C7|nr:hypothetical protein [Fictibacillus gelatini]
MTKSDFFFCYNKRLFTFLKDVKSIDFITVAKNTSTGKTFAMFYKNDILQKALDEYKTLNHDK